MDARLPGIRQEAGQLLPAEASLHSRDLTWPWPDMWAMFDMFGMVSTILRDGRYCHIHFYNLLSQGFLLIWQQVAPAT